jgi:hypothetical protein
MKTYRSFVIALAMTVGAVYGFVCPLKAENMARCSSRTAVSSNDEGDVILSTGGWMRGFAFSALFGLAMVMNPLPSAADGRAISIVPLNPFH